MKEIGLTNISTSVLMLFISGVCVTSWHVNDHAVPLVLGIGFGLLGLVFALQGLADRTVTQLNEVLEQTHEQ